MTTTPAHRRPPAALPSSPATLPATIDSSSATTPQADPNTLPPDSRLGRYVIRKVLGQGGMGCVYLAWDEDLRRTVAVKVMHPSLTHDGEHRLRFLREARAVAALSHDNVVSIFEANEANGVVFYAMPHLSGMSLARFLAEKGRPSVAAAVRITREVAGGLAAAHAVGLLHRDVKPGNVFLEAPKGRVKLLDFGLATASDGGGRLTEPGMVVGTPAYMSPEQARGLPLDPRSDLFSLGAVLYHLCAGRMPFDGPDSLAVLTALAVDDPPPVASLNPQVPERLERLIGRLLSKDPAGRPASAAEVVGELKAIERELVDRAPPTVGVPEHTEPVAITPPTVADTPMPVRRRTRTRTRRPKRSRGRRSLDVALIAGVILLAMGGGLGLTLALTWGQGERPKPTPSPTAPHDEREKPARPPWPESLPGGRVRWMAEGSDGEPKQLPDWWKPGQPLPPGFRLPEPPPRP